MVRLVCVCDIEFVARAQLCSSRVFVLFWSLLECLVPGVGSCVAFFSSVRFDGTVSLIVLLDFYVHLIREPRFSVSGTLPFLEFYSYCLSLKHCQLDNSLSWQLGVS